MTIRIIKYDVSFKILNILFRLKTVGYTMHLNYITNHEQKLFYYVRPNTSSRHRRDCGDEGQD